MTSKLTSISEAEPDRVYEGLRIPYLLNNTTTVNFVLTQEPGKLKPKDLKLAIEKNRREKEQRAAEQKKIREEGGGAGLLDLRGILAEERLNMSEGDPFKRQLREMAFLADVDDVEKQETEKTFRISEDYLGSNMLTPEDIQLVKQQRKLANYHKRRTEWRNIQSRQHTNCIPPHHQTIKAGTKYETAVEVTLFSRPSFDPNKNDIWGKRLNTLRRFISLVGRWLIRKRVKERMDRVKDYFHEHGAFSREEVKSFIDQDNLLSKKQGGKSGSGGPSGNVLNKVIDSTEEKEIRPVSAAAMVLNKPNEVLLKRQECEKIISKAQEKSAQGENEVTPDMLRRILFPKCVPGVKSNNWKEVTPLGLKKVISFDDRTYFHLKTNPEYVRMGYKPHENPIVPFHFPPCEGKGLLVGATEESVLRPAADNLVSDKTLNEWYENAKIESKEPEILGEIRKSVKEEREEDKKVGNKVTFADDLLVSDHSLPGWMQSLVEKGSTDTAPEWSKSELDFFNPAPQYRVFNPLPRRCELDCDWILRPDVDITPHQRDSSLRSKWCSESGFLSANVYLLNSRESRNRGPFLLPGPTLTDVYNPDQDRHMSGLMCYTKDHLRGTYQADADIRGLQSKQDERDHLTDSESDEEEGYSGAGLKPSLSRVRAMLKPVKKVEEPVVDKKGGKGKGKGKVSPRKEEPKLDLEADTNFDSPMGSPMHLLDENQKKEEQVELLRDRKSLDIESTVLRNRKENFDAFTEKLVKLSKETKCLIQALPVQLPFHQYEEKVYQLLEPRMPELSTRHTEFDPNASQTMSLNGLNHSQLSIALPKSP